MTIQSIIDPKKKKQVQEALRRMDTSLLPKSKRPEKEFHSRPNIQKLSELSKEELQQRVKEFRADFKARVASLIDAVKRNNLDGSEFLVELNKRIKYVLDELHEMDRDLCDQSIELSVIILRFENIQRYVDNDFTANMR
jgi:hypothetical protein